MNKELMRLRVKGEDHEVTLSRNRFLLDALRDDLGLTGTKRGCDDSSCGCCAVLIEGVPMLSCVVLAASYQGCEITTVESLGAAGALDAVQEGFVECGEARYGYCTPGFMITVVALLKQNPNPLREEIRDVLSSDHCRCTGYM
jgi:carbon-monoxide dehydrogenase small subunit